MKKTIFFAGPGSLLFIAFFGVHNPGGGNITASGKIIPPSGDSSNGKTCMDCHAVLFEKIVKHPLRADNACGECHKKSGIEHPQTGAAAFLPADKMPDMCLTCHADIKSKITGSKIIHGAVNDKKSCTSCHSPHSSAEKKLLVAGRKEVCLSCHNKPITVNGQTFPNIEQQDKNSKVIHPPFKKCSKNCHNPHASDNFRLLSSAYPEGDYAPGNTASFELCFTCHDAGLLETAASTTASNFRNGDKNLHFVHVNKEKGRKCTFCHYPHATVNAHLIRDVVKFGNFEFKLNYQPDSTGGSCFPGCHGEKKYNRMMAVPDSLQGK